MVGSRLAAVISSIRPRSSSTACIAIAATGASEVWITHGQEDALVHWSRRQGLRAHPLEIVGYGEEDEAAIEPKDEGDLL